MSDLSADYVRSILDYDAESGSIGAFPNNRLLWVAPEWFKEPATERPDFIALDHESMAE